jgi:hypothetical protein
MFFATRDFGFGNHIYVKGEIVPIWSTEDSARLLKEGAVVNQPNTKPVDDVETQDVKPVKETQVISKRKK